MVKKKFLENFVQSINVNLQPSSSHLASKLIAICYYCLLLLILVDVKINEKYCTALCLNETHAVQTFS